MPTDTTQLGYYYQKVPTWVPVPGMIPPPPQPEEWHHYGSTDATAYAPCPGTPIDAVEQDENTDANDDSEIAPIPPMPVEEVEMLNLERTVSSPRLLPILDTSK